MKPQIQQIAQMVRAIFNCEGLMVNGRKEIKTKTGTTKHTEKHGRIR
ncbi:hypothetical protein LNTAR_03199 [Lentisphaera araneosa HTCC2155]|uniref:Uncharacterized protein n=1 Tax=Lentisphaera araneosa HTCC2155 TaxID=313628 RepID=A6DT27_9BACT|nr:hypothetical protein LNTAR_03199 [Lentisphaera araneosa HTCC2155]